jgi:hypothetical protein
MTGKEILMKSLNLTDKEFSLLADYAYCDRFNPKDQTVSQWQQRQIEAVMEEEGIEQEIGEPLWRPGDKSKLISIFYRKAESVS